MIKSLFEGYKTFEPSQMVLLTQTKERGMVLRRCSDGRYDVMVLGANNVPTGRRWIVGSKWIELYPADNE